MGDTTENSRDLYGKLDALFEKRSTDGLVNHPAELDDFPVLSDVVHAQPQPLWAPEDSRVSNRRRADRRQSERRAENAVGTDQTDGGNNGSVSEVEVDRLIKAMEVRLDQLFVHQQAHVEELVRQAIRIEFGKQWPD